MDRNELTEALTDMQAALVQIFNETSSSLSFEHLYRTGYSLVLTKCGGELYRLVCETIWTHLERVYVRLHTADAGQLAHALLRAWDSHERAMAMTRDVLLYLEKNYIPHHPALLPIRDLGLYLFRECIFLSDYYECGGATANAEATGGGAHSGGEHGKLGINGNNGKLNDANIGEKEQTRGEHNGKTDRKHVGNHATHNGGRQTSLVNRLLNEILNEIENERIKDCKIGKETLRDLFQMLCKISTVEWTCGTNKTRVTLPFQRLRGIKGKSEVQSTQSGEARGQEGVCTLSLEHKPDGNKQIYGQNFFSELFEKPILQASNQFYVQLAHSAKTFLDVPAYLLHAERIAREELKKAEEYLPLQTQQRLNQLLKFCWIETHADHLIQSRQLGCRQLFDLRHLEDMRRLYEVLSSLPQKVEQMQVIMRQAITAEGQTIFGNNQLTSREFIRSLLALREKYARFVAESFHNQVDWVRCFKTTLEGLVHDEPDVASRLSQTMDEFFRYGIKHASEKEVNWVMDEAISIFVLLPDKDVFENCYKNELSKRLVEGSDWAIERTMATRLRHECGQQYTAKLEGLINDREASEGLMRLFNTHLSSKQVCLKVQLNVGIFSLNEWPVLTNPPPPPPRLPPTFQEAIDHFEEFYVEIRHKSRKLLWILDAGMACVETKGKKGEIYTLEVSTSQMLILNLFNSAQCFTFSQMQENLRMSRPDLGRDLMSLCYVPQFGTSLLKRERGCSGREDQLSNDDVFSVNPDFRNKNKIVKFPSITEFPSSGTFETASKVSPEVQQDQQALVEAAIVRLMKVVKQMPHAELCTNISAQLAHKFIPSPKMLKDKIEKLIEREYLERDSADMNLYRYVP